MQTILSCLIELPENFRRDDILKFHQRDPFCTAERVDAQTLQKGVLWNGFPACLIVRFYPQHAETDLVVDGKLDHHDTHALTCMVRRMLGLTQAIEAFEQTYRTHPQLGPLIAAHAGLRVPLSATPFEALTWAITGQQISVHAAVSVRRKFIQAAGLKHSSGLWCYPDAQCVMKMAEADLRQAGLSQAKTQTILTLSHQIMQQTLPLDTWLNTGAPDDIRAQLMPLRGIGPWTINYTLLRGYGWLDGSLHGDAAVRRKLQALLAATEKVTENFAQRWLKAFSPWRALVAAHLWAYDSTEKNSSADASTVVNQ